MRIDMGSTSQLIFTATPEFGRIAFDEIRRLEFKAQLVEWLDHGVGRVELSGEWTRLAAAFHKKPPVFIRHICPAQVRVPLKRVSDDLEDLVEASRLFFPQVEPDCAFSVQPRLVGSSEGMDLWPYERFDINQRLAAELRSTGAALDVRQPDQVFSVVCTPDWAYLGLSRAADNLSDWAGGARRFKREAGQVSRAEFKLLEALELFELSLTAAGTALDLGAAPGGWTRVLRRRALHVVAVDPADLHPLIESDPAVIHLRQTAQAYLAGKPPRRRASRKGAGRSGELVPKQYDVILNDMRLEALESAQLMVRASAQLKPGGVAVITLKLPAHRVDQVVAQCLVLLKQKYQVMGARQLFHNRREVTVALKGKLANG